MQSPDQNSGADVDEAYQIRPIRLSWPKKVSVVGFSASPISGLKSLFQPYWTISALVLLKPAKPGGV